MLDNDPDWERWVGPMLRAGLRCEYCGLNGRKDANAFRQLCRFGLDHLIPRSLGGTDAPENLVVACGFCQLRKAAYDTRDNCDDNTPRGRMIAKVKERLRGSWKYHDDAWTELRQMLDEEAGEDLRIRPGRT